LFSYIIGPSFTRPIRNIKLTFRNYLRDASGNAFFTEIKE